jgi:hypothetical protein
LFALGLSTDQCCDGFPRKDARADIGAVER